MSDRSVKASRATIAAVALAAALASGAFVWARKPHDPAEHPRGANFEFAVPQTNTIQPPVSPAPVGAGTNPAVTPPAPVTTPFPRKVVSPDEILLGPKEPLIPPEIKVEAQIVPRGTPVTNEPLVPKVIGEVTVDDDPRGAPTAEPLVPRTITVNRGEPERTPAPRR